MSAVATPSLPTEAPAASVRRAPRAPAAHPAPAHPQRPRLRHRHHLPAAVRRDGDHGAAAERPSCSTATTCCRRTSPSPTSPRIWATRLRRQPRDQPADRRRLHRARAAGRASRRLLHRAPPLPRAGPRFLLLVLATQMFQPAAMLVGIQREFTTFDLPAHALAHPRQRRASTWRSRCGSSTPTSRRSRSSSRRRRWSTAPAGSGRSAADHPAAGRAGHRHRADLHLHRRLERVHRRADAVTRARRVTGSR